MGQYFTFINIDKRQQLKPFGGLKMGEFFFSAYPSAIMGLVSRPRTGSDDKKGQDLVSWEGDRIICVGDYVDDWPDNILTADDCQSLEPPMFLYSYATRLSSRNVAECPVYPGSGAVLRNLTKKIYVRASGIPAVANETNKLQIFENPPPDIDCMPGLGTVLLSRVGWSADTSAAMSWKDADTLTQGEWAGDRFDIKCYDDVEEQLKSEGWIDNTDEEAIRITGLWKADGYYDSD